MAETTTHTEASMLRRLAAHLGKQGDQHALVIHPRNAAGFDAGRTLDALSMSLWPSRGLLIDGWEVKVSRSDWLRELKSAQKAEAFAGKVDRFWLLVGDRNIVKDGELPPDWGLMAAHGKGLRTVTAAKALRSLAKPRGQQRALPPDFHRSFLAALMREAVREGDVLPTEIKAAVDEEMIRFREAHARGQREWQRMYEELAVRVRDFENGLGTTIGGPSAYHGSAKDTGRAVRAVLAGDKEIERLRQRALNVAKVARTIGEEAEKQAEALQVDVKPTELSVAS